MNVQGHEPGITVKTVRFSEVVKRCGPPEPHLILLAPEKDKALQSAVKSHRVMTLVHSNAGTKVDYGNVGFEKGSSRQYLIFPKSLRAFTGRKVVGIKYDLLSSEEIPKSRQAPRPRAQKTTRPRKPRAVQAVKESKASKKAAADSKIIPFRSSEEESDAGDDIRQMKRLARQAMKALEDGKQVAAFNLLKRILTL